MLFGRPGGPFRALLAFIFIGVVLTLILVVVALNIDLARQEHNNQTTLQISHSLVSVNDRITQRLSQVTDLAGVAAKALDETKALGPLLVQLHDVTATAANSVDQGRNGVQASASKLTTAVNLARTILAHTDQAVANAQGLLGQGNDLLGIVQGLIKDVQAAVTDATRINNGLPLPQIGG